MLDLGIVNGSMCMGLIPLVKLCYWICSDVILKQVDKLWDFGIIDNKLDA